MQRSYSQPIFSATNIIIAITVVLYIIENSITNASLVLGLNLNFSESGFWWQPVSSMFTHGNLSHIFMNMFMLFVFGNLIESAKGSISFILLYFICGILTSLLSYVYIYNLEPYVNLVGASGAISAILGYIAYLDKSKRVGMLVWVALISFAPLLMGLPIAWYGHIIGFVVGYIYGMIRR